MHETQLTIKHFIKVNKLLLLLIKKLRQLMMLPKEVLLKLKIDLDIVYDKLILKRLKIEERRNNRECDAQ